MQKKSKDVAVFLRNPNYHDAIRHYALAHDLNITYIFCEHNNPPVSPAKPLHFFINKGTEQLRAVLKRKKAPDWQMLSRNIKGVVTHFKRRPAADQTTFMAMVEFVTNYRQCQGLLVYDIKDLCPEDPSVAGWLIEKIRTKNKCFFSVVPEAQSDLSRYPKDFETKYNRKWAELQTKSGFQFRECPPIISICIFENHCFLKCRFCYQIKNPRAVIENYMDSELFYKIINDIPSDEHVKIVLGPGGEPLTYPKIHEMVRYVSDNRPLAITEYSTNGVLMNRQNAIKIIESGLKRIEVSLNAPSREDYKWFTGSDAYDTVVTNMIGLIKLRKELGSPTPVVVTKVMGIKRWVDKIDGFLEYWNNTVDEARVSAVSYYQDEDIENIDSLKQKKSPLIQTCFYLTNNIIINPNGRYQFCCSPDFSGEKYGPVDLGNARDKSIMEVWNSEKFNELRKINARGLPIFANCLNCNINNPDFCQDLIVKSQLKKILGAGD